MRYFVNPRHSRVGGNPVSNTSGSALDPRLRGDDDIDGGSD